MKFALNFILHTKSNIIIEAEYDLFSPDNRNSASKIECR